MVNLVLKSKALYYYSFVQLSLIPGFLSPVLVIWWWLSISINVAVDAAVDATVAVFVAFFTAFTSCRQCCGCFGSGVVVVVALKER